MTETSSFMNLPAEGIVNLRFLRIPGQLKPFLTTKHHCWKDKFITCYRQMNESKWVGDCPLCWVYNELWRKSEGLSYDKSQQLTNIAYQIKPLVRHRFLAIDRANEDAGVKIYCCGNIVSELINKGISIPAPGRIKRITDDFLIRVGLKTSPDLSVYSTTHGHDFRLTKKVIHSDSGGYPNYDRSAFVCASSPLGTKKQIAEWQAQAVAIVNNGLHPSYLNLWPLIEEIQDEFDPLGFRVPSEYDIVAPKIDWTMELEVV